MFTKLHTNAVRHKNNFKYTNYDLDRRMTTFMKTREERINSEKELKIQKEMQIAVAENDENACDNSIDRLRRNLEM